MVLGCPVGGPLPFLGSWDIKVRPASLGLSFDDLPHHQWNEWLAEDVVRRAEESEDGMLAAKAVLEKTMEEIKRGLCSDLVDMTDLDEQFGRGYYRTTRRFAIPQPGDVTGTQWQEVPSRPEQSLPSDRVQCGDLKERRPSLWKRWQDGAYGTSQQRAT